MSAPDTAHRTCECGCGTSLDGRHPSARFHDAACRAQAWKAKTRYGRRENARNARANGRKRPVSVRISYRKARAALTERIPGAERQIDEALDSVLTERQREALHA